LWRKARPSYWPVVVALGLITGGAVGNLIDRAIVGKVTDFLYFAAIDFPVFNIADSALIVGVGILIVWLLFGPEPDAAATDVDRGMVESGDQEDQAEATP
jgi:signal peptidase II